MEEKIRLIQYEGKNILHLDFSNCKAEEILSTISEAKKVIASYPETITAYPDRCDRRPVQ